MSQLHDIHVTMVRDAYTKHGITTTLYEVVELVRSPMLRWRVKQVRNAPDEETQKKRKERIPAITPSCVCGHVSTAGIKQFSGVVGADIDHLADLHEADALRTLYSKDPYVLAAFISVRGCGVKIFFRVDPGRLHLDSWQSVADYVLKKSGHEIDTQTKDPARLCFLSWDEHAYAAL